MRRAAAGVCTWIGSTLLVACGAAPTGDAPVSPTAVASADPPPPATVPPRLPPPPPPDPRIERMMRKVEAARGLRAKHPVVGEVVSRDELLRRLEEKVAKELPDGVLEAQGDFLKALGLIDQEYDFVAGVFHLLRGRIAGFYEPEEDLMVLLDDLGEESAEETLAHELVHALQDQSFDMDDLLGYEEGETDETAAAQGLIEGEAMAVMLDVMMGDSMQVDPEALRRLFSMSTAMSPEGEVTPMVLQSSLVAPYTDGFAFLLALRRRGGWAAVDRAWQRLPSTTEQLLHIEKYLADEAPIEVDAPSSSAFGPDYEQVMVDSLGEQGLRIMLEEWTPRSVAVEAAAGWGGDRYVVAHKVVPEGRGVGVAVRLVMDSEADAQEVAAVLRSKLGSSCKMRPELGPLAWKRDGARLAIVAGTYLDAAGTRTAEGDCATALPIADQLIR